MKLVRFLKLVEWNVLLVNIQGNLVRLYYTNGDATDEDWYDRKTKSVQI